MRKSNWIIFPGKGENERSKTLQQKQAKAAPSSQGAVLKP